MHALHARGKRKYVTGGPLALFRRQVATAHIPQRETMLPPLARARAREKDTHESRLTCPRSASTSA